MRDAPASADLERDLRLSLLWPLAPRVLRRLRDEVVSGRLEFPWRSEQLARLVPPLSPGAAEVARQLPEARSARELAARLRVLGLRLLIRGEIGFPENVAAIPDPPPFLFARGAPLADPEIPRVGIVGSRAASDAGREIAYTLARDLALAGCVIVSGLARGIDGESHRGALEAGGRSVAVLGTGADLCYPPEHEGLYRALLERGGVLTEFPPGVPGLALHFPRRNRILSALCDLVIVVEGGERSGARSTVDFALDQGRELMAVPRDIHLPGSVLPNLLLRDGAAPALGAPDVLFALGTILGARARGSAGEAAAEPPRRDNRGRGVAAIFDPDSLEARILETAGGRGTRLERCLAQFPEASIGAVQAAVARLELMGQLLRLPGGRIRRVGCGHERVS